MTSRSNRESPPHPPTGPSQTRPDSSAYSWRIDLRRVTAAGTSTAHAVRTDPDLTAEPITNLFVDTYAAQDRTELADLVGPLWTAEHTRRALRLSCEEMQDRRETGALLALNTADDGLFYPVAQFTNYRGEIKVKPALKKFMMILRDREPWTIAVLVYTPAPELGNLTPLDWVRAEGDTQPLLDYAAAIGAEYAR